MMREIVLDTETTGLDPYTGHRLVEIGAIELINHLPSGRYYHQYINPERDVPQEAFDVHGLSNEFLSSKPVFKNIATEFLEFIKDGLLIIHNAPFDLKFLNAELSWINSTPLSSEQVIDTLVLARKQFPMGPNSLDALCRRYGIDNSRRDKHGALLDSELLADVYIELIGGRQTAMSLTTATATVSQEKRISQSPVAVRKTALPKRLSAIEITEHERMVQELGENALWKAAAFKKA